MHRLWYFVWKFWFVSNIFHFQAFHFNYFNFKVKKLKWKKNLAHSSGSHTHTILNTIFWVRLPDYQLYSPHWIHWMMLNHCTTKMGFFRSQNSNTTKTFSFPCILYLDRDIKNAWDQKNPSWLKTCTWGIFVVQGLKCLLGF